MDKETLAEAKRLVISAIERGETKEYFEELFDAMIREAEETSCEKCSELVQNRTQMVPSTGNKEADIMFIGEAPGADEDKEAEPFVGKAGQILNSAIEKAGWNREDLYITNVINCRPPENRTPKVKEVANCSSRLDKEIEEVSPKVIICLGSVASRKIIHPDFKVSEECGKVYEDDKKRKLIGIYHPASILRKSEEEAKEIKKEMWKGLMEAKDIVKEE